MATGPGVSHPGEYEQALQAAYESFLAPGDVAIDVGAHLGRHTLPIARRVLPGGKVLAFEPLPFCRASLSALAAAELPAGAVELFPFALGEKAGSAEFVVAKDSPEWSGLRERVYDAPTRLERIPVEVRVLDEVAGALPRLRYVKIDAEGGELHILAGARGLLRRLRPIVSLEFGVNSCAQYGVTPEDMIRLLRGLDYRCFDLLGREVSEEAAFVASATLQEVWDYLAVPVEQVEVFERRIRPALADFFAEPAAPGRNDEACRSRLERVDGREPISIAAGGSGRVLVRVANASPVRWGRRSEIRLGLHWHAPGQEARLSEAREELPLPMAPGAEAVVKVGLRPVTYRGDPLPPGKYEVWISPLIEGVCWFTDRGDRALALPVTVR